MKALHQPKVYFENLDGLRFACFLSVFLFHSFHTSSPDVQNNEIFLFVKKGLFGNGFLGVNFFFVLSGFLITYLLAKEKSITTKINIGNFWIRRILRIWPLYFACVAYGFLVFPLTKIVAGGTPNETADYRYYLAFVSNFDYIKKGLPDSPGLGVLWSVAIEEQFYFFWPLILSLFKVRQFWIPLATILCTSIIFRHYFDIPILHEMHTLSCIGDMALGGLGAWMILQSQYFRNFIKNLPKLSIGVIYLTFLSCFLFRDEFFLTYHWQRVFERLFISTLMLLIILEQCYSNNSFFKMNHFKRVSNLGIITYGLYCIHFIVISLTAAIMNKLQLNQHAWQVLLLEPALTLSISIIISRLSYRYFEAPFLRLKEKFSFEANRKQTDKVT